jgi:hypothetical protein
VTQQVNTVSNGSVMAGCVRAAGIATLVQQAVCCILIPLIVSLLGSAAGQDVKTVATEKELDDAIRGGAAHIMVTSHIDARGLQHKSDCPHIGCTVAKIAALQPQTTLLSIRVRCRYVIYACCGSGYLQRLLSMYGINRFTVHRKQQETYMQGNCSRNVPELPPHDILNPGRTQMLELLDPGQCLLYTNKVFLNFFGSDSSPFQARP